MSKIELKNVVFMDREKAESKYGWPELAMISISSGIPAKLQHGWHSVLRLQFDDIDVAEPEFQPAEPYVIFNEDHAKQVIEFVTAAKESGQVEGIMVHCHAGISRSAAVAKWIAEKYGLPFSESYSLYNRHIYRVLRITQNKLDFGSRDDEGDGSSGFRL